MECTAQKLQGLRLWKREFSVRGKNNLRKQSNKAGENNIRSGLQLSSGPENVKFEFADPHGQPSHQNTRPYQPVEGISQGQEKQGIFKL